MRGFSTLGRLFPATLFAFLFLSSTSIASTVIVPRDDEMIVRARAIVRGKVIGVYSKLDENKSVVFTYVTLRVKEVLKGEIRSREVVVKLPGGEDAGITTVVHGTPGFSPGEDVLVYLASWSDGSLAVDNLFLGKFSIIEEPGLGQRFVVREAAGSHVDIVPGSAPGAATDRMELGAYRQMIKDRLRANRDRARAFEEEHYGVPIRTAPPEHDPGRSGSIQPQFHLLFNTRWFEPDDNQPVLVTVVPDNLPTPSMMDDVAAACTAWSTVPGCALRLESGSTTTECLTAGLITVTANVGCSWLPPSSGFIAFSGINGGPTRKTVNGVSFAKASSGFLSLNPNAGINESCQLREVLTHEMGHAVGLSHSWDSSIGGSPTASDIEATMFWVAHFDGRCASLRTDDENGIRFIYPGVGGGPTDPVITSSALPVAVSGAPYTQTFTAIGGARPYTWGLASGSSPLPPGFNLTTGGVLSGTPTAVGTTIVRIRVADSGGRSAERDFSITVASSGAPLNAVFVSQSVPSSIGASQSFNVSFTWRNAGVDTWSSAIGIKIGSQNPPNSSTWGGNRVSLPGGTVIAPGQQLAITFTVFAPGTAGTYNLQFQLMKDGQGFFGDPSTNVAVKVIAGTSLTLAAPPSAEATVGLPFSLQFSAVGGVPPYTWSILSGELPNGLGLGTTSGIISGAPLVAGTSTVNIKAIDSEARTGEKTIEIVVKPPPVQVTTASLVTAVKDSPYSQQISATGGTPPYVWLVTEGTLPGGLALEQNTGMLSGTPTATGSFAVTVTARDTNGVNANKLLSLLVVGPDAVPHLNKAKYKSGAQKLIMNGDQFSSAAVVLVDEREVAPKSKESNSIVIKPITLAPGQHSARVVNPFGVSSQRVTFNIE